MIGKMLGNRYEILDKLGGGGMAIVYKSRDTYLNRLVTIKALRPEFTTDEDFIRRFRREAQAVAKLSHPNIVNIHDVGQEDSVHYLVMEYVQGDNLKTIIKKNEYLSPDDSVRIAIQVCEALEHAHENNIVHRDVKPHNILITAEGRAKLTDFGIAMEATSGTITRTDAIMGSVHYLSPEQARGETATTRSDIYAVGILLYEMLTGEQPYSGDTPIAVVLKHIQDTPLPVNEVNPDVPGELAAVVMRAMEKKPENRYQSAMELARYLQISIEDPGQVTVMLSADEITSQVMVGEKDDQTSVQTARKIGGLQNSRVWIWATVMLFAGLLAGGLYGFNNYLDVPNVEVPNVVGMIEQKALDTLKDEGLKGEINNEMFDEEYEKGVIIAQSIGPDDLEVKPGRTINLTISKGIEQLKVPILYNKTVFEAERTLRQEKLSMAQDKQEKYHDEVEEGRIIEQEPYAGKSVPKGSEIKVTISKGPKPQMIEVPDLTRNTLDEARSILETINLALNEEGIVDEYNNKFSKGQIIRQSPEQGTEVEEGTEVNVVLNNGSPPSERDYQVIYTVPDDGKSHEVIIEVVDSLGENEWYNKTVKSGEKIIQPITHVGSGEILIYLDGVLQEEETRSLP